MKVGNPPPATHQWRAIKLDKLLVKGALCSHCHHNSLGVCGINYSSVKSQKRGAETSNGLKEMNSQSGAKEELAQDVVACSQGVKWRLKYVISSLQTKRQSHC